VIDVEQRALRALEQHGRAAPPRAMHGEAHVLGEREQARGEALEEGERLLDVRAALAAEVLQLCVRVSGALLDERPQATRVAQVEHAHAAARDLVLVGRADAAPRRADLAARRALAIHRLVIREDEVRAVADVEPPLDVHAVPHELVDLGEERVRIEDDAVADRAADARMEDPARDLVEHERLLADVHRVAGVGAPLVAHDPVGVLGEHVDQLPLPLVTPLRTDDDDGPPRSIEHAAP
jgi:hypothetical protein